MEIINNQLGMLLPDAAAFNQIIAGKPVSLYVIKNKKGMVAAVTNFGASLVSLFVNDKAGNPTDVVVGFDTLNEFTSKNNPSYFGATVGRYANRIANAKFSIDGVEYKLAANNGANSLHGGLLGFHCAVWDVKQIKENAVEFNYTSADGEEGFPGALKVTVTYTITDEQEIKIDFEATTDKKTICNLTNHTYFNLNGIGSGAVTDHMLMINANTFTPVDENLIPTGEFANVENTAFDFRIPKSIGSAINDTHNIQIERGGGYDHSFVINKINESDMLHAATAKGDKSDIIMEVHSTEPGIQFYSANFEPEIMLKGRLNKGRYAFCVETQHFPDSPNQSNFPSTILEPGDVYKTTTVYKFGVQNTI